MSSDLLVTRRAVSVGLVAAAASTALLTAGCDGGDVLDLPGLPEVGEEPDRAQVLAALQDEQRLLDQLTRTRRKHRRLGTALAGATALHSAHVDLLTGAVDDGDEPAEETPSPGRVPADPAAALAQIVRSEQALSANHVGTAMKARSGVLARVLASMSAAAAQQAVVLGELVPGDVPAPQEGR